MTKYYFEIEGGLCGIREADDINSARNNLQKEVGTGTAIYVVRKATEDDINWVDAMSGVKK